MLKSLLDRQGYDLVYPQGYNLIIILSKNLWEIKTCTFSTLAISSSFTRDTGL